MADNIVDDNIPNDNNDLANPNNNNNPNRPANNNRFFGSAFNHLIAIILYIILFWTEKDEKPPAPKQEAPGSFWLESTLFLVAVAIVGAVATPFVLWFLRLKRERMQQQ